MPKQTNREMIAAGITDVPHYLVFILLIGITLWAEYAVFSLFIPPDAAILRWSGLATTEVGAFGWMLYHKNHKKARSRIQLRWSHIMIWVDVGAAILCAMFELLAQLALHGYGMDNPIVSTLILVGVVIVLGLNLIAYFVCFHYTAEHVAWLNAPADEQFVYDGGKQESNTQRPQQNQPPQKPQVRVEEDRPQKSSPQQKQPQLPSGGQQALPAPKRRVEADEDDMPVQQPSQHLPGKWRNDSSPLPAQSGGNSPYQNPKKPLPEQVAHRRPPQVQVTMEDIPRNPNRKAQSEAAARDRLTAEQPTTVLQQNHSPSEQMGDWD